VEASKPNRPPTSARRAAPDKDAAATEVADAERRAARDARQAEDWVLVEEVRDEAAGAVSRGSTRRRSPDPAPLNLAEEVRAQLAKAVGNARSERVERRLGEAAEHFESERYADAGRILKKLSDEAPTVPAVRELYGLNLYRQEKWTQAARELEAFRQVSGSVDQHPVLADCYRALRQWPQVDELWEELRAASPDAELVTEGRIVMAGSLADRDRVSDAIRLLQAGWSFPKRPKPHHLRRAYALADLYERAGELPRARDLFQRIRAVDTEFADVGVRLRNLR
jgi:tetratricopeptide (TPR) repeat protein